MGSDVDAHPDPIAARLEALDTPVVSDALTALGRPGGGVVIGIGPVWPSWRIAGKARTVRLAPPAENHALARSAPSDVPKAHLGARAIERSVPGDIIVIDHQGRSECAGWGGLLSAAAVAAGVRGVVIDGACRDVEEADELNLPVFARSATPTSARGLAIEVETGAPVSFGGLTVDEGDYILVDRCGIVVIPASVVLDTVSRAEDLSRRESNMRDELLAGAPVTTVMDRRYETMLDRQTPTP